jgi:hypothetical protein
MQCARNVPDPDRGDEHLDSSDRRRSRHERVKVELEPLAPAVGPPIVQLSWNHATLMRLPDRHQLTLPVAAAQAQRPGSVTNVFLTSPL